MASTNTLIKNLLNVKNTVVESAKNYTDGRGVKHLRVKARPDKKHQYPAACRIDSARSGLTPSTQQSLTMMDTSPRLRPLRMLMRYPREMPMYPEMVSILTT